MVNPLLVVMGQQTVKPCRERSKRLKKLITHFKISSNLIAAVLSGLLLFLSFPKFGSGILAWVALIPLFYALRDAKPWEGFKTGFLAGLVAHIGILYWISFVVVQYGQLPVYMGIMAMLLLAAYLSLYTACFAMGVVFLRRRGGALFLSAPLFWTILEFARSHLLTGFPWENLAYSQYLYGNIIQIADITGIYGISFAIVMVNAALYNLWSFRFRKRYLPVDIVIAFAVIAAIYGYGYFRTAQIRESVQKKSPVEVALIQGNIDQNIKWDDRYQLQTLNIYRSLSLGSTPAEGGLIVWPETAAPFYFEGADPLRAVVVDVAQASGRRLLFGSPSYDERGGKVSYSNSAYMLRPDGTVAGRYDKVHLVPYGEYVPLRQFFPFISKIVVGVGDFRPGTGFNPIESDGRRIGVLICYEAIFPESAREYKQKNADLLVNITNDAWFGKSSAPYQHLSMTVFRAVENRLYLVRAANTGISAIIDPTGKILSQTGLFERTVLKGEVKYIDEKTFYASYGDLFVYLCGIVLIPYYFVLQRRRKNAGRSS
jgi:apolipoprotein N-acyltransferase